MIPIKTPARLSKFPIALSISLIVSMFLTFMYSNAISSADSKGIRAFVSLVVFPSRPMGALCLWYLWIFFPCFWNRIGRQRLFDALIVPSALCLTFVFSRFSVEASVGLVTSVLLLGFVMRDLIWESVDSLVFGPKIFSVYAVPCYVHLFFFLFYVFLSQLWRPAFGMPGGSVYLICVCSFLLGFMLRETEIRSQKRQ